jgi:hypothetical protein
VARTHFAGTQLSYLICLVHITRIGVEPAVGTFGSRSSCVGFRCETRRLAVDSSLT